MYMVTISTDIFTCSKVLNTAVQSFHVQYYIDWLLVAILVILLVCEECLYYERIGLPTQRFQALTSAIIKSNT